MGKSEPEVIVIWAPGDGNMHMIGCHHNDGDWKYSKPVIMPSSDLNDFIAWRMEQGMVSIDARLSANLKTPGMGKAVPILLIRSGFDPKTQFVVIQSYIKPF